MKENKKKLNVKKILVILSIIVGIIIIVSVSFKVSCKLEDESESKGGLNEQRENDIEGYNRYEVSTYLTFPEWHLVYISEDYTKFIEKNKPSKFPYLRSIGQFWKGYCSVYGITSKQYDFYLNDHVMIWVIGVSTSIEYGIKGIYENTAGKITEWLSFPERTAEDEFAYEFNKEYVNFIYDYPWYMFSFAEKFGDLWTDVDLVGKNMIRKWERRWILSLELSVKTVYGGIIRLATRTVYGKAETEIYATVENISTKVFQEESRIKKVKEIRLKETIILIPRYRVFTEIVPELVRKGIIFKDIAGNDEIFMTIIAPEDWEYMLAEGKVIFIMEGLNQPELNRVGVKVPVQKLHTILPELEKEQIKIEHIYDY